MKIGILFLLLFVGSCSDRIQTTPFQIVIEPLNISGMFGLQSFAYGQDDGKWLIIGGRTDGLHRRQPWAAFDVDGQNKQLIVVDPKARKKWSAPLASLSGSIQEQLCSCNMEFHQEGDYLYIVGGYGYSKTADDHVTYPYLTAVKVSDVINAIVKGDSLNAWFRQIKDEQFAVTGGSLNMIYHTYYLTGGQRFEGRYNPMGHPSYVQTYTNAVRKFTISDNGTNLNITHLTSITDTTNLHRRDFNVIPQIMPNGQEGLTAFSGVFQVNADLPFLSCVNIDSTGYSVNDAFSQYYNQYHCAHVPLYNKRSNEMHNLFFGGISQFTDSVGNLIRNDNVPFVKTIARVTRDGNGKMTEIKMPIWMPTFLGASSEFIRVESIPKYNNEVIKLDELQSGSTLIGYIVGGINSSLSEIFWINDGTKSSANSEVFKVYVVKNRR